MIKEDGTGYLPQILGVVVVGLEKLLPDNMNFDIVKVVSVNELEPSDIPKIYCDGDQFRSIENTPWLFDYLKGKSENGKLPEDTHISLVLLEFSYTDKDYQEISELILDLLKKVKGGYTFNWEAQEIHMPFSEDSINSVRGLLPFPESYQYVMLLKGKLNDGHELTEEEKSFLSMNLIHTPGSLEELSGLLLVYYEQESKSKTDL